MSAEKKGPGGNQGTTGGVDKETVRHPGLPVNSNSLDEALESLKRTLESECCTSQSEETEPEDPDPEPEYWWQR
jgi:hypothetical protein